MAVNPEIREDVTSGETASANAPNAQMAGAYRYRLHGDSRDWPGLFVGGILQNDRIDLAGQNLFVSFGAFLHRTAVLNYRRNVEGASCEQVEEAFHVPVFRPAHVANGIIFSIFFV